MRKLLARMHSLTLFLCYCSGKQACPHLSSGTLTPTLDLAVMKQAVMLYAPYSPSGLQYEPSWRHNLFPYASLGPKPVVDKHSFIDCHPRQHCVIRIPNPGSHKSPKGHTHSIPLPLFVSSKSTCRDHAKMRPVRFLCWSRVTAETAPQYCASAGSPKTIIG